jgi:DNA processing protein
MNLSSSSHASVSEACAGCLERTWAISRLAGHLDAARGRALALLELGEHELIRAVGGADRGLIERELVDFDADLARQTALRAGLSLLCRCAPGYPERLRDLAAPPAVLHVAGRLECLLACSDAEPVAIVGTRDPTRYGVEVAGSLGRRLAGAGIPVLSGMARGIDSAAHAGALESGRSGWGGTVAVLAAAPERPYPRSKRALHAALVGQASVVAELGPGTSVRRWMFPARNRIIAALAELTVVVEAGERSGALLTARLAHELGRQVGAVPGRVTSPQATGPNGLLAGGAAVIRDAQDAVDVLFGAGARELAHDQRPPLSVVQTSLLRWIEEGHGTAEAVARAGLDAERALAELGALELAGRVRRGPGGAYVVIP